MRKYAIFPVIFALAGCGKTSMPTSADPVVIDDWGLQAVKAGSKLVTVNITEEEDTYATFVANRGDKVIFLYPEEPNAWVEFEGSSPFDATRFRVNEQQGVRMDAGGYYHYHVLANEGRGSGEIPVGYDGNGTGEIPVG